MVEMATAHNQGAVRAGRVELQWTDGMRLPYADATFDNPRAEERSDLGNPAKMRCFRSFAALLPSLELERQFWPQKGTTSARGLPWFNRSASDQVKRAD